MQVHQNEAGGKSLPFLFCASEKAAARPTARFAGKTAYLHGFISLVCRSGKASPRGTRRSPARRPGSPSAEERAAKNRATSLGKREVLQGFLLSAARHQASGCRSRKSPTRRTRRAPSETPEDRHTPAKDRDRSRAYCHNRARCGGSDFHALQNHSAAAYRREDPDGNSPDTSSRKPPYR